MKPPPANGKTLAHYGLFFPFVVLFALTVLGTALGAREMYEVFVHPDDWFRDDPYQTRVTDTAMGVTALYINVQALAVSALLYRCNQRLAGLVVLLLPFILGTYLANVGIPH